MTRYLGSQDVRCGKTEGNILSLFALIDELGLPK